MMPSYLRRLMQLIWGCGLWSRQRASGSGSPWFTKGWAAQGACNLRLPPELLYCVLELLPMDTAWCFAMTCKEAYTRYRPVHQSMNSNERARLLSLLEPGYKDRYFCDQCSTLHHLKCFDVASRSKKRCKPKCYHESSIDTGRQSYTDVLIGNYEITYFHARAVCNHVLRGHSHGVGIASLTSWFSYKGWGIRGLEAQWDAGFCDRGLIVRGRYYLPTWKGDAAAGTFCLSYLFGNRSPLRKICQHVSLSTVREDYLLFDDFLNEATRNDINYSCPICFTDFDISVRTNIKARFVVNINVYKLLGMCRSSRDIIWTSITTPAPEIHIQPFLFRYKFAGPGSVRAMWPVGLPKSGGTSQWISADIGFWHFRMHRPHWLYPRNDAVDYGAFTAEELEAAKRNNAQIIITTLGSQRRLGFF